VHREVEGDEAGALDDGERNGIESGVNAGDLVALRAEHRGGGSEAEGLAAKLVGRHEEDVQTP
jgi:hypothetical protein